MLASRVIASANSMPIKAIRIRRMRSVITIGLIVIFLSFHIYWFPLEAYCPGQPLDAVIKETDFFVVTEM